MFKPSSQTALFYRVAILIAALCIPALLLSARPTTTTITVVNNSNQEIRHLYLSSVDQDNWGPDLLNNSVVRPGESFTINNPTCSDPQIKVVGEDQNGCFVSGVVSCSSNSTWTITTGDIPNCGN